MALSVYTRCSTASAAWGCLPGHHQSRYMGSFVDNYKLLHLGMFELKLNSVALSVRQFCSQAQLTYSCWITASRCGRLLQYNDETFSNTRRCRKTRQAQQNIPSCLCLCCLVSLPCSGEYCQHCTAVSYPHSMLCNPAKAGNTAKTPPSRVRYLIPPYLDKHKKCTLCCISLSDIHKRPQTSTSCWVYSSFRV